MKNEGEKSGQDFYTSRYSLLNRTVRFGIAPSKLSQWMSHAV